MDIAPQNWTHGSIRNWSATSSSGVSNLTEADAIFGPVVTPVPVYPMTGSFSSISIHYLFVFCIPMQIMIVVEHFCMCSKNVCELDIVFNFIKKARTRDCAPSCSRLFLMLQPFPIELKGRWKKLQEEWCFQHDIQNQSRL
ncbi:uncharacterized protein [Triticum aestivum]|uniref:uncharacterized protein n=1 Tax=Triticum aestivum TaxID=4565 RepID=UPI001D0287FC|nr:uncharacterized protein LOC123061201 [Triticum aestivum]